MQHNIEHDIEQGEDSLPADFLHIEADRESNGTSGLSWFIQRWRAISRRFQANTFSPGFLASPWSHPAFGYFFAILGQVGAVAVITLILRAFPNFHFSSSLILLVVLLAALGWGAGPSLVATLAGTFLFISFFTPHIFR